ncbi:hypoxia-inducible factor 1-alpha-like [Agrilus planipennis]|uniref:Hypoxia-inducible factor 1-alpha-like n=1 Tax=Agrilus planipennis TaxID=224129 RepID=A0A7F5R5M1_AGRPL|nr:hypoxia-inducible factor 1-alpha-like [Agrilus planipennis]
MYCNIQVDLMGQNLYEYSHPCDHEEFKEILSALFSKGQCETSRYRFLAKTGGYVWVLTQATLIHDKLQKPQSVVCVNYVISGIECEDEIYSSTQLLSSSSVKSPPSPPKKNELCPKVFKEEPLPELILPPQPPIKATPKVHRPQTVTAKLFGEPVNQSQSPQHHPPLVRPQTATFKIFAPRTEDMSKGFLTFSEEEPGLTLLKDEPDDLTHLAPVAGDVCISLEEHPYLTDVLDEFFLKDNFAPLLNDEPSDPFISYRDSCDPSPQLLSPNTASKSSDSSMSSLSSPAGEPLSEEDRMSSFMSLQLEDDDPDLLMKAPYIPMDMGDDLPLLIPDDLVWNSSAEKKCTKEMEKAAPDVNSSLAQLLCSSTNKHGPKSIDKGGGNSMQIDYESFPEDKKCNWTSSKSSEKKERNSNDSFGNKRTNSSSFGAISNKRIKSESKEKMSPELLQQLMLNNTQRGKSKGKSNWLLDSGQKAACISQPSDSVLMNLLNESNDTTAPKSVEEKLTGQLSIPFDRNRTKPPDTVSPHQFLLRKNSLSLLDPEATSIASLLDLTRQDYEVNAPVKSLILQGEELLKALEGSPHLAGVQ